SKSVDSPPARRKSSKARKDSRREDRPPSPPDTDVSGQRKRPETPGSGREGETPGTRPSSRSSWVSRSTSKHESRSRMSKTSSQATYVVRPAGSVRTPRGEDHR